MTPEEYDELQIFLEDNKQALKKYAERNAEFMGRVNHLETYAWLKEWEKKLPVSSSRYELGEKVAKAMLRVMAQSNRLHLDILCADDLDEELAKQYLDRIAEQKEILTKL